ncbi:MAG: hypothetical protein QNJ40_14105 [Xanthomonadales bacterium]|nr:hypothetical protein [Xanthomonadales bacterium]
MKRNTLTSAVLAGIGGVAGLAGIANAVNLNPDGLGEVLIYPYYTVNNGNQTLLSVVNTTNTVKAVKVRFLDGKNSREVLDFNLYLSPYDVWTGVVLDLEGDDTGAAAVATADTSCTVPSFAQSGVTTSTGLPAVPFRNLLFGTLFEANIDDIDTSLERTREGHFEMIEMGVVDETVDGDDTGLEDAANHQISDPIDVPDDCAALVAAWVPGGVWNAAGSRGAETDVRAPDGGLFGAASIINVLGGYQASYNADAIAAFYDPLDPLSTLHNEPGSVQPSLNQADTGSALTVQSIVFNQGTVVTSDWLVANRVDAVSAVYMHDQIFNEYAVDSVVNGATEWVATFPTKNFYVNQDPARLPFTAPFDDAVFDDGASCEPIGLGFYNREERDPGVAPGSVDFSPSPTPILNVPVLCYEAQVITFGQEGGASDILGSPTASNISLGTVTGDTFENGWAFIDFTANVTAPEHTLTSSDGDVYSGLPVTGFAIQVVNNSTLVDGDGNNVLSNYAGLFGHRYSKSIVGS